MINLILNTNYTVGRLSSLVCHCEAGAERITKQSQFTGAMKFFLSREFPVAGAPTLVKEIYCFPRRDCFPSLLSGQAVRINLPSRNDRKQKRATRRVALIHLYYWNLSVYVNPHTLPGSPALAGLPYGQYKPDPNHIDRLHPAIIHR